MTTVSGTDIERILREIIDPYLERDLVSSKCVKNIVVEGSSVSIDIVLGYPALGYHEVLSRNIKSRVENIDGIDTVNIKIATQIVSHVVQKSLKPMRSIKNIIAVASGKGGVGKSTTAVNLALALTAEGARVGILDADIYGPSQPLMLGLSGPPDSRDRKTMEPKVAYGLQSISIGYLVDADTPMIWRGPMVTNALQQLVNNTNWDNLDYLIVDLPPGTGDIQLTLSQQIPVSGAVIITTPQDIALLDAQKGLKMFEQVEIPVLGIIENMSIYICGQCGHEESIFGAGGGLRMSKKHGVELLGALPLDIKIREQADSGCPTVVADPDSRAAQMYREIARKLAASLSKRAKDFKGMFPKIEVQNN